MKRTDLKPGIYFDLPENDYHADPCIKPSLSHSILKTIINECELKAFAKHPRFNEKVKNNPTKQKNDGTVLHALCLKTPLPAHVLRYENYKTQAAQNERDKIIEAGLIPILAKDYENLADCADAFTNNLEHFKMKGALENGHSEVTVIWKEKDVYCRARVDFLPDDPKGIPIDLKFTSLSASPLAFSRTIQKEYATQAAFYMRGLRALGKNPSGFRFIVTETYDPYCASVFECAPSLVEYADALVEEGIQRWRRAIKTNKLPSYPNTVCSVEATPWMIAEAEEKRFIYKEGFAA